MGSCRYRCTATSIGRLSNHIEVATIRIRGVERRDMFLPSRAPVVAHFSMKSGLRHSLLLMLTQRRKTLEEKGVEIEV